MPASKQPAVHTLSTATLGRYLVMPPPNPGQPPPLLVGLHGYGENAETHLEKLRGLPGADRWLLVAVQGLHRFYNSKTGAVIASWMTSQDREQAIADNIAYVSAVVARVRADYNAGGLLGYAGFSQGVAMAYRAACGAAHGCDALLALAGDVPPEIVAAPPREGLPPVLLARGTRDSWYTQEKMDRDLEFLAGRSRDLQTLVFEGGHEWSAEFNQAGGEFLAHVLAFRRR